MDKLQQLKEIITEAETQREYFYQRKNLKAGTRYRRLLQEAAMLARAIRLEVLAEKQDIAAFRYQKRNLKV